MGSVEVTNFNGDVAHESLSKDSVSRLHDIVHRLEEENEFLLPLRQNDKSPTEHSTFNGFVPYNKEEEEGITDTYSLENVPPLDDNEFDEVDYEKDDSWLYSTPKKSGISGTHVKNADDWLKENAFTPELLRVRGSLSEKLEVIAIENRKGSYERLKKSKEDFRKGSTLSLDWDFEDDELSSLGGGSLGPHSSIDEFGSDPDISLDWGSDLGAVRPRGIQAWAESSMPLEGYHPRPSPPDWSDDEEDDFSPMQINLSQSQCQPRKATSNMAFKRGAHGQNIAAVRPRTSNNDQHEFTAKPTGAVKPRRSAAQQRDIEMQYEEERTYSSPSPDYDSGPVVPRGRVRKDIRTVSPGAYEEPVSAPVILRGTAKKTGHSSDAVSPRGPANVVKPVQRRKPLDSPDSDQQVRPRGTGNNNPNQVRPRGSGNKPTLNNQDSPDSSLKVSLSSMGDGAAVRRRGPVQTAEVAPMPRRSLEPSPRRTKDHSPRRNKDPVAAVREQEVPVRRSTGSLPQSRSNDNLPRPRRSFSPTGVVRPRGAPPM